MLGSASNYCFYVLLVVSPLVLGSNRPIFWAVNGLLAGASLLFLAAAEWPNRYHSRFSWKVPLALASVLALVLGWIGLQSLFFWPPTLQHPIWAEAGHLLPVSGAISLAPHLTLMALAWSAPLAIFLVAARLGTSRSHCLFALRLLLAVIGLVAAFGLLVEVNDLGTLGIAPKEFYNGWLTGTFVSRNTAAAFFAIGVSAALALSLESKHAGKQDHRPSALRMMRNWINSRQGFFGFAAALLWFAAVLTGSRGGVLATTVGAGAILLSVFFKRPANERRPLFWALPALLGLLAIAILALLQRADNAAGSNLSRLSLYREAISAVADRPLLGHGAGAYEALQPLYHSEATPSDFLWNHAHSAILEMAAGIGLPAAGLVAFVFIAMIYYLCAAFSRARGLAPAVLAAIGALTALGFHAMIDFSVQTQAVALYAAILAGLGIGEAARCGRPPAVKVGVFGLTGIEVSGPQHSTIPSASDEQVESPAKWKMRRIQ